MYSPPKRFWSQQQNNVEYMDGDGKSVRVNLFIFSTFCDSRPDKHEESKWAKLIVTQKTPAASD